MRKVFRPLRRAGVGRGDLVLAWDFTVASRRSITSPMLHMRNEAFAGLGDTDLTDLKPEGRSPRVRDHGRHADARPIRRSPGSSPARSRSRATSQNAGCAVGAGFNRGADGLPEQKPGNTYAAPFRCVIPRDMPAGGGRALLYGHGLLGSPLDSRRLRAGAAQDARAPAGLHGLRDLLERALGRQRRRGHRPGRGGDPGPLEVRRDHRPAPAGHAQHALPRAARWWRPTGSARSPRSPARSTRSQRLFYDGNSQGGIEGGALTAVAPDFDRAVLGVVGHELLDAAAALGRLRAVPRAARRRLPQAARPDPDLLAALEPVGPRRVGRLRAAHDDEAAAADTRRTRCCCTSRSATTRSRR